MLCHRRQTQRGKGILRLLSTQRMMVCRRTSDHFILWDFFTDAAICAFEMRQPGVGGSHRPLAGQSKGARNRASSYREPKSTAVLEMHSTTARRQLLTESLLGNRPQRRQVHFFASTSARRGGKLGRSFRTTKLVPDLVTDSRSSLSSPSR